MARPRSCKYGKFTKINTRMKDLSSHLENVLGQTGGQEPLPLPDAGQLLVCGQDQILNVRPELLCQLAPGSLRLRRRDLLGFGFVMLLKLDNLLLDIVFLVEVTGLGEQTRGECHRVS